MYSNSESSKKLQLFVDLWGSCISTNVSNFFFKLIVIHISRLGKNESKPRVLGQI